ncbi:ABC transporter permease [Desulfocurvus sp. DL9XJH121]
MLEDLLFIATIAVKSSMAVLFAAVGEVLAERSGVLNLGVEGMMLFGAMVGAAAGTAWGDPWLAAGCGMLAGAALAAVHGFFAITLGADQTLSGLAITILGGGLAGFLGRPLIGVRGVRFNLSAVPGLSDIPVLGDVLFRQNALAYAGYVLVPAAAWVLFRTSIGLKVRAVGEDAAAADAMGVNVPLTRWCCVLLGGLLAGLGGCYLSLAYTPGWKDGMTMGQGWIAVAMVIFSGWRPGRAALGALLFGALAALQWHFEAGGVEFVPAWVLKMLPYVLTIAVLVLVRRKGSRSGGAPQDLGRSFRRL